MHDYAVADAPISGAAADLRDLSGNFVPKNQTGGHLGVVVADMKIRAADARCQDAQKYLPALDGWQLDALDPHLPRTFESQRTHRLGNISHTIALPFSLSAVMPVYSYLN
jgi:hypothetical protein